MKNFRLLSFLPFLLLGFAAEAQTETVALAPKKLQQLYLSVGTGPAATSDKESNAAGGAYVVNITGAFGPSSIFRVNLQHSLFTNTNAPTSGMFGYLSSHNYDTDFYTANENSSINFLYGKRKQISQLLQFQVLGGIGFNYVSKLGYGGAENINAEFTIGPCIPENYYSPGLLLQAEAMFLPTKFAGLTLGTYANITPKMPSAGLNLSLNLGLLRR